jgi:hypothetical protein
VPWHRKRLGERDPYSANGDGRLIHSVFWDVSAECSWERVALCDYGHIERCWRAGDRPIRRESGLRMGHIYGPGRVDVARQNDTSRLPVCCDQSDIVHANSDQSDIVHADLAGSKRQISNLPA